MLGIVLIGFLILIGIMAILVVIGAGKLRTEEEMINDIEEEAKALKNLEEHRRLKKLKKKEWFEKLIFWRKNG